MDSQIEASLQDAVFATCQNCKRDFSIEPDDLSFYEKIKVPLPTFCPECRSQRRNAWWNVFSLYSRQCDFCKKSVISLYAPNSGITIYCNKCWWSDKWDPKSFGADYDFYKPFFTQYKELIQKVPHISIINDDGIASLNCEYTQDWWFSKNCYMAFSGSCVENVMYSFFIFSGKDIVDCMNIRSKNEWLYECTIIRNSYQLKYSQFCTACIDSQFLHDCIDCSDCFMCAGLRNKKYFFQNNEYSKEEYEKILESYKLDTFSGVEKAQKEFDEFILKCPRRHLGIIRSVNSTGEFISNCKNTKNCFVAKDCENCRYCDFVSEDKDSRDLVMSGDSSECYEGVAVDNSQLNLFGIFSVKSQDVRYTQHCHNCKHVFGCVGLRDASYCIFNKQYSKEEYEELVPKIMEHMDAMPYEDKIGNKYRYGEFYPIELSPFGYNETNAIENFLLTKNEAKDKGFNWQDNTQITTGKETLLPENIPDSIDEVGDFILGEVLACIDCKRNYRIVSSEFAFYKKMRIPIPRRCFYCRHGIRLKRRNPFKLWHRKCAKEGCENEFETSYSPQKPEIVYCEKCYQKELY